MEVFLKRTFLELPKNCVSPKAWTTNSVGVQGNILRDGLMGCLFGAIVYGFVPFHWLPGVGVSLGLPVLIGFKVVMDYDYDTAVSQTRLNTIISGALDGGELGQTQLRYLKRKYFKRHDYSDEDIKQFFIHYGNTKQFCSNEGRAERGVGISKDGLELIKARGYESLTELTLASLMERGLSGDQAELYEGATELEKLVMTRFGHYAIYKVGKSITPKQFFELARVYAQEHGIKRVFRY